MKNCLSFHLVWVCILSAMVFNSCEEKKDPPTIEQGAFTISFDAIAVLDPSYQYCFWLVAPIPQLSAGQPDTLLSGVLNLSAGTDALTSATMDRVVDFPAKEFAVRKDVLSKATRFIVSIERAGSTPTKPSSARLLAGTIADGKADLTMNHELAFGQAFMTKLENAQVKAVLKGFTGTATGADSSAGLWFVGDDGGSTAGITDLPPLPSGWIYEGWLIKNGRPEIVTKAMLNLAEDRFKSFAFSTGKFTSATGADEDGNKYGKADGTSPAFPGGDFIENKPAAYTGTFPRSITNGDIFVISLAPENYVSPLPFGYTPFAGLALDANSAGLFPDNFDKAVRRGLVQPLFFLPKINPPKALLKGTFTKK